MTWADLGKAAVEGAITGGVAVFAGPMAGTIVKSLGFAASKIAVMTGAAVINAVSGVGAYSAGEGIKSIETGTFDWDPMEATISAMANAGAGTLASVGLPTKGTSTLNQAEYFSPRTITGFINPGKNATAIELGTIFGTGTSAGIHEAYISSVYPQETRSNISNGNDLYYSQFMNYDSYSFINPYMQYYNGYYYR
jgi:hypothetical protein